jgi:hypothetical protein
VVLEPGQVRAERERDRTVVAECRAEMLVDVRVDREDRAAQRGQVAREHRRRRRLAAATLADERDSHPLTISIVTFE